MAAVALAVYRTGGFLLLFNHRRDLLPRVSGSGRLHALSLFALCVAGASPDHQCVGPAFLHGHLRHTRAFSSPGCAHRQHDHGRGHLAYHLSHREKAKLSTSRAGRDFSARPTDSLPSLVQRTHGNSLCAARDHRALGLSNATLPHPRHYGRSDAHRAPGRVWLHRSGHHRLHPSSSRLPDSDSHSSTCPLEFRPLGPIRHGTALVYQVLSLASGKLALRHAKPLSPAASALFHRDSAGSDFTHRLSVHVDRRVE